MSEKLTHIDEKGQPSMVDVGQKNITKRSATASCKIIFPANIYALLSEQGFHTKKGPIIDTAIIAATMAVKQTHLTIPFCHALMIEGCKINIMPIELGFEVIATVKTEGKTGVEMEALHGASIAALTIYDMCKALSHDIQITDIQLMAKTGGKNDFSNG